MKQILPIVLIFIAVAGAGFVAKMIRGTPEVINPYAIDEAGVQGGDKKGGDDGHGGGQGGGQGDGHGGGGGNNIGYFRFKRDFIVPVMRSNTVDSLVLLRLSIEMDQNNVEDFRPKEPRLRDAFMQALMGMSHDGLFREDITDPKVYEEIQRRLLKEANGVMDNEAQSVLILDFARQDQ